jgi:predicted transcriptional regulator
MTKNNSNIENIEGLVMSTASTHVEISGDMADRLALTAAETVRCRSEIVEEALSRFWQIYR